jgi:transcriptional regulator with XRE-family HTH domain
MTLGERLKELRRDEGWTLQQLADACGSSVPYLSDMEHGRALPTLVTLERVADAYALSLAGILRGVSVRGAETPLMEME